MRNIENDCPPLFVNIAVPYEVLADSGINLNGAVQFFASDGKIVVEQINLTKANINCDGSCDTCPMLFYCDNRCEECPCVELCDKRSDEHLCPNDNSALFNFLDQLGEQEQYAAIVHLSVRWAEKRGGLSNG